MFVTPANVSMIPTNQGTHQSGSLKYSPAARTSPAMIRKSLSAMICLKMFYGRISLTSLKVWNHEAMTGRLPSGSGWVPKF